MTLRVTLRHAAGAILSAALAASVAACGDDDTSLPADGGGGGRDAGGQLPDAGPIDAGTPTGDPTMACTAPSPAFTAAEQMLVDLPAGTWWQAPSSKIRDVCPTDREGCAGVVSAWSGGALDPVQNRMLVFGGGHADYSGNELYAFELATLAWRRLTEPSSAAHESVDPLPDGQPVSRHSYDGLAFITHANRLLAHGGSRWRDGSGTGVTWTFDPTTTTWRDMMPADAPALSNCCDEASAYDPTTRKVIFHLTNRIAAYDYDANRWEQLADLGYPPLWPRYEAWGDKRGVMDTRRGLAWFLGSGLVMVWNVASNSAVTDDWITTGGAPYTNADAVAGHPEQVIATTGGEVITANGPGADYDPVSDDIVAWVGGGVWALDLGTKAWSHHGIDGAPATPQANGTYGRFRYVARTNVFVLVTSVDDDVWFYKHTPDCGR